MRNMILCTLAALALAGCARGPSLNEARYSGLSNQPPFEHGECLVLGRDNVWRRCQ